MWGVFDGRLRTPQFFYERTSYNHLVGRFCFGDGNNSGHFLEVINAAPFLVLYSVCDVGGAMRVVVVGLRGWLGGWGGDVSMEAWADEGAVAVVWFAVVLGCGGLLVCLWCGGTGEYNNME
jgi:hypothetical protein